MARTQRGFSTLALGLALGLAYCSGGDAGKPDGSRDDPRGVNERVRTLVSRFSYGAVGPYAASAGGNVFAPSQGGPFEGSDSAGIIGPPSLSGGAYDRADFCSSACQLVATCLNTTAPSDCASDCSEQVQLVASRFGNGCLGPLVDFYSCFLGAIVCSPGGLGSEGDDDGDGKGDGDGDDGAPLSLSPDVGERCAPAALSLLSCANRSDLGELFGDDDDEGGGMGTAGSAAGNSSGGSDNGGSSSGGNGGGSGVGGTSGG